MRLSMIVPTYNERKNVPIVVRELNSVFKRDGIDGEIIIVDDNSPDGTGDVADSLRKRYGNLKVLHRKGKLGLSSAVFDGMRLSKGDIIGVMDADLSHPFEAVPRMFREIRNGADFVIGSRYVKGGGFKNYPFYRIFISRVTTLFVKILTSVNDPMSGFLMIRKSCLKGVKLDAKGFKVCLEFLMKAKVKDVREVPIIFTDRKLGSSKAGVKEYYLLVSNILRYVIYKFKRM